MGVSNSVMQRKTLVSSPQQLKILPKHHLVRIKTTQKYHVCVVE